MNRVQVTYEIGKIGDFMWLNGWFLQAQLHNYYDSILHNHYEWYCDNVVSCSCSGLVCVHVSFFPLHAQLYVLYISFYWIHYIWCFTGDPLTRDDQIVCDQDVMLNRNDDVTMITTSCDDNVNATSDDNIYDMKKKYICVKYICTYVCTC